ncbi:spermidine synthase [Streptomyces oceani]|uniref:Spermine synthase n=1 Tax=Streptomyces oceani TaxID=1075402 RepID=A0A1E7KFX2_9ACTN|nr:fused MFS/spermidine synthase [Streptomyces oceani]OEV02821.1 spermine synthase [Streptomyces oceani]
MARKKGRRSEAAGRAAEAAGRAQRRTRQRREAPSAPVDGGTAQLWPDPERARGYTLFLDGAPQSYVDLDDPGYLDFAYQRRLGHILDLVALEQRPVRVLHLGGGALTLARYTAATRPRSTQQVLELDGALVEFVRRELPLPGGSRIRVRVVDARAGLSRVPDGWADLLICDVFRGARTPPQLSSVEFLTEARRTLCPGGWYAANLTDGPVRGGGGVPLAYLRGQIATAREVFEQLCLLADPAVLRGRRYGNAVLLGANAPLPLAELTRRTATDPHHGRLEHGGCLVDFVAGARPVTDATAIASPAPPEEGPRGT